MTQSRTDITIAGMLPLALLVTMLNTPLALAGAESPDAMATLAHPVGWRMDATGYFEVKQAPRQWSSDNGIAWKTDLEKFSNASPIVVEDRIFVCIEPATLACIRRSDGKLLWQRSHHYLDLVPQDERTEIERLIEDAKAAQDELPPIRSRVNRLERLQNRKPDDEELKQQIAELAAQQQAIERRIEAGAPYILPPTDPANGHASSTPVSDGKRVFALFGTGIAGAYTLEGELIWRRLVQRPSHIWGHSASPVLVGDTVILHLDDLFGIDAATGETRWQRKTKHFWGTPVQTSIGKQQVVITPVGEIVRVRDGHVMAEGLGDLEFNSPLIQNGMVYFIDQKSAAYRLPDTASESLKLEPVWTARTRGTNHYASPVLHEGLVYAVSGTEILTVLDAATGDVVYAKPLRLGGDRPNSVYPSLCVADGHIYIFGSNGVTVVLAPGREYSELHRNQLEPVRSTPVFVDGQMYLRGNTHLYAIEGERRTADAK